MKKKKIEAFPPIPLRESQKKYYRMVAGIADFDGEEHLLCDVYKQNDDGYEWIRRAAFTKKDSASWYPVNKEWHRKRLCCESGGTYSPEYDECDMIDGPGIPKKADWKNTAADKDTIETIQAFCKEMGAEWRTAWKAWKKEKLHAMFWAIEAEIESEKRKREYAARKARLEDRCRNMPELPDDFAEWADLKIFDRKEYIYYKRKGSFADCQCSKCGESYRIRIKRPESYEAQALRVLPVPADKEYTHCELCGAGAIYKPRGRMRGIHGERNHAYLIQPFKETGTVVRYFDVRKEWCLDAKSWIHIEEVGRTFFDVCNREKTDWNLHDNYTGENAWHDRNIGGYYNLSMQEGILYRRNMKEWKTKRLLYSGFEEYSARFGLKIKPCRYLSLSQDYQLEKLVKLGLFNLTRLLVDGWNDMFLNGKSWKVENILKIRRCRLGMLTRMESLEMLKALQFEKINTDMVARGRTRGKGEWTEEEILKARSMALSYESHKVLLEYMTITQLINRIERYIGRPVITTVRRDEIAIGKVEYYRDYLKMRVENGMDMERSTAIFPKDLKKAHADVVNIMFAEKDRKKTEELEARFPEIRKRYRKLKAMYGFRSGDLFIRPAKCVQEIIEEGRTLHHCVAASDTYFERHAKGTSAILFIRSVTDPNMPYITVEATGESVCQWYGEKDRKPDKEKIEAFLAEWLAVVSERRNRPQKEIVKSDDQQMLAAAV